MEQYIKKSDIVAEIKRLISNGQVKLQESQESNDNESYVAWSEHIATCIKVLSFLDTLEVKELHEDIDVDLNPFFEEMGVEPDSRLASIFKGAFYKCIDKHLNKKENKGMENEIIKLRRLTGLGISECRKAYEKFGNIEEANKYLRNKWRGVWTTADK